MKNKNCSEFEIAYAEQKWYAENNKNFGTDERSLPDEYTFSTYPANGLEFLEYLWLEH